MRKAFMVGYVGFLIFGCAELLPSTDPGTPGGGKYCNKLPHQDPSCYPTEADRLAAWNHTDQAQWSGSTQQQQTADAMVRAQAEAVANEEARKRHQLEADELSAKQAAQKQSEDDAKRKERDAVEKAKVDREADIARKATNKAYAAPAIAAIICSIEAEMTDDRSLIDRERRVAAIGGTVDLRERHELASELVDDADELKLWRAALHRYGGQQAQCKDLAGVIKCRESALRDCDPASLDVAAVWYEQFETLWGHPETAHRGR